MKPIEIYKKVRGEVQSVYRSRLQVQILLSLGEGNRTLAQLREVTGSSSQAIIPKIRKLESGHLIENHDYEYQLTPQGRILSAKIEDFILSIATISRHKDFWMNHYLEGVPKPLLDGIGDLYNSTILSDTNVDIFQVYSNFLRIVKEAKWIHGISTIMSPGHGGSLADKVAGGLPVELVVSPQVAEQFKQEPYSSGIEQMAGNPNFKVYLVREPFKLGITVTDKDLSFGLYKRDGITYDTTTDLISGDARAISWGERLFEYYKERSTPLI